MLPSRLFRNTGLPPPLRSLLVPHSSLPATVSVQLRLRLGVSPGTSITGLSSPRSGYATTTANAETARKLTDSDASTGSVPSARAASPKPLAPSSSTPATTASQSLEERLEPRLSMTFTCTVENCGERSTHEFTKRAYTKGIVLVECPGCKNRHLIADHLGWFKESTEDGKLRTVEDILKARGEKVRRGRLDAGGVVEYSE